MNRSFKDLLLLYASPEEYLLEWFVRGKITCCFRVSDEECRIVRRAAYIRLLFSSDASMYQITIPMTRVFLERCREMTKRVVARQSAILPQYNLTTISCTKVSAAGAKITAEAIVQELPQGELFSQAIEQSIEGESTPLFIALDALERGLQREKIGIKGLRTDEIILGKDGLLYPFCYDDATFDEMSESSVDGLRELLTERFGMVSSGRVNLADDPYHETLCERLGGYLSRRKAVDGLSAVEDLGGWGFVDEYNRSVVEAKYMRVSDFADGFARVQFADSGLWGVIDTEGQIVSIEEV